jgi:hypothetical protein
MRSRFAFANRSTLNDAAPAAAIRLSSTDSVGADDDAEKDADADESFDAADDDDEDDDADVDAGSFEDGFDTDEADDDTDADAVEATDEEVGGFTLESPLTLVFCGLIAAAASVADATLMLATELTAALALPPASSLSPSSSSSSSSNFVTFFAPTAVSTFILPVLVRSLRVVETGCGADSQTR